MIQTELKQENTENTLLTYTKKINILPLDKFASIMTANIIIDIFDNMYAFMLIFSIACKTWVRHNNGSFWMKSSVTQWKEQHFDWFSYLECE